MIIKADARQLPIKSELVQCCVTSPPYFNLRKYLGSNQIGLERSVADYIRNMVLVFDEVRRVLKPDGTLWLNLGDTYCGYHGNSNTTDELAPSNRPGYIENMSQSSVGVDGFKNKDLMGIPWRVAFALQDSGWYLRTDIIWSKSNGKPESVSDRPTRSHEYIFLFSRQARYFYDIHAIKEKSMSARNDSRNPTRRNGRTAFRGQGSNRTQESGWANRSNRDMQQIGVGEYRNRRSVWEFPCSSFRGGHFATFPEALPELCILASSRPGDIILDPFGGSGTVACVAQRLGRRFIHIDLAYHDLAIKRISQSEPTLF